MAQQKAQYYRTPEATTYFMVTPRKVIQITSHAEKAAVQTFENTAFERLVKGQTLLRVRHEDFKAKQQEAAKRMMGYWREILEEVIDYE